MKVLVPLDGSRLADAVVSHVVALLQQDRGACELHLLRVVGEAPADQAEARVHLAALDHLLAAAGFRVRRSIVRGEPVRAILDHVAGHGIDLVAMATHGRSGLGRWLRGSVAEGVVQGCSASVLLVNPHGLALEGEDLHYRRIVLPVDASTVPEVAFPLITRLAAASGASVVLMALGDPARALVEDAARALEARGIRTATSITLGAPSDPARSILAASEGRRADLIVLCTGPRRSPWPIGRAEEQVTREAPCAVLLLRAADIHDPAIR
jgi:nucleotide-binding universal stress UspA family protein